jgi:hypothetical protein
MIKCYRHGATKLGDINDTNDKVYRWVANMRFEDLFRCRLFHEKSINFKHIYCNMIQDFIENQKFISCNQLSLAFGLLGEIKKIENSLT